MKIFYSNVFKNYFLLMLSLFASEIIFRIFMGINILDMSVLRILLTVNIIALLLSALSSLFGRIAGNILTLLFSLAFQFYMILQANLYSYLGTFVSFKMTGTYNVVREYLADFMNHINWMYLLIAVP